MILHSNGHTLIQVYGKACRKRSDTSIHLGTRFGSLPLEARFRFGIAGRNGLGDSSVKMFLRDAARA